MRPPSPLFSMPTASLLSTAVACAGLLAVSGCARHSQAAPIVELPIDTARVTLAEAVTWPVQRSLSADLDGDGAAERLSVASDVGAGPDGEPRWEDGHRWATWVTAPGDSARTLLYGAFVPNGRVDVSVEVQPETGGPGVVFLERGPTRIRVATVRYDGPGRARLQSDLYAHLSQTVPFP